MSNHTAPARTATYYRVRATVRGIFWTAAVIVGLIPFGIVGTLETGGF